MPQSIRPLPASTATIANAPPAAENLDAPVAPTPDPVAPEPERRLIIEHDKGSGAFVYKTIDPRNGEVISQYPTKEILKLREDPRYQAGALVLRNA